jgi:hypothetical protein
LLFNLGEVVSKYINKNGMSVGNTPKELFEELMRGTGFVIGSNASLYMENAGLHDKNIVVSRIPSSNSPEKTEKFPVSQFEKAADCFNKWE